MSRTFEPQGLAVIHQAGTAVAIWHVSLTRPALGLPGGMLTGAWVLASDDGRIKELVSQRVVVSAADGEIRVGDHRVDAVTLDGLSSAITTAQSELDEAFESFLNSRPRAKRSLVPPSWPEVVERPTTPTDQDEPVASALAAAREAAYLIGIWDDTESIRIAREYLHDFGGPAPRSLPEGWA